MDKVLFNDEVGGVLIMKLSRGEKIFNVFNLFLLSVFTLAILIPMLYIIKKSLDAGAQSDLTISLWPKEFTLIYYKIVFNNRSIYRSFLNSIFITGVGTALALFLQTMGAYTLTKRELPGAKIFLYMLVIPMMFSGGIIPYYLLMKNIGMMDKIAALIIPSCISGWNIFLIRNYFWSIPMSMIESAKIDGANEFTIYHKVMLPLSAPVIAAIGLFTSVSYWNAFFDAIMFMRTPSKYPFPVILQEMIVQRQDNQQELERAAAGSAEMLKNLNTEGIIAAIIVISVIPIMAIYPFLQKHFNKGIMVGAIKG